MHVRFTKNASVRGVSYRPGQRAELDHDTANAYIATGQCVSIDTDESETDDQAEAKESSRSKREKRG